MKLKKIVVKCRICNKPYSIFEDEQLHPGMDMCKACRTKAFEAELKAAEKAAQAEREAWAKDHTYTCKDCGETFVLTKDEYEYFTSNGLKLPVRCKACRSYRRNSKNLAAARGESEKLNANPNPVVETRVCKDCGKTFTISADEAGWFKGHDYALPVRCKACRHNRKKEHMKAKNTAGADKTSAA